MFDDDEEPDYEFIWCTVCGERFTVAAIQAHGKPSCPTCGNEGVPCADTNDVAIEINWQELRCLGIWASNWVEQFSDQDPKAKTAVHAILRRIQRQYPDKPPLTMGGELREVREAFPGSKIETHGTMNSDEPLLPVNGPGAVGFGRKNAPWTKEEET